MAANKIKKGISFDGIHTFRDFGLYVSASKRPYFGGPEPKTNTIEIPGADGVLDFTEANAGEVKFKNRELKFTFWAQAEGTEQEALKTSIRNALHGKVIQRIIWDDDPEWFYSGRCSVDFPSSKSWKLQCVITVDAAPYAMKVDETVIELIPNNHEYDMQRISIGTNNSTQPWNSKFELGTMEFPGGISSPGLQDLIITFGDVIPAILDRVRSVNITDSDGNVYAQHITVQPDQTEVRIPFSDITQAGVNLQKVYRVLVTGIGGCGLYVEYLAAKVDVWNERKNVLPVLELDSAEPYKIGINGKTYLLQPGITQTEEIRLVQGNNAVYLPLSTAVQALKMTYREGKI